MRLLPAATLGLLVLGPLAAGQSLYGIDQGGATALPFLHEMIGQPADDGAEYPSGSNGSSFSAAGPGPACTYPYPFAGLSNMTGDTAVDRRTDTIWAVDFNRVGQYRPTGERVTGFHAPYSDIRGLESRQATGTLWITNGSRVTEVDPTPKFFGCATLVPVLNEWDAPAGFGTLTDLALDPSTGTLWVCDALGQIGNLTTDGELLSGPTELNTCSLLRPFRGIAVDTATPNAFGDPVSLFVTDGFRTAHVQADTHLPARDTFYAPFKCQDLPAVVHGLGYASHGIEYGGTPDPIELQMRGQSVGGGSFSVTLSDAPPAGRAYLILGTNLQDPLGGFLDPPLPVFFPAKPLHVEPGPFGVRFVGTVGASGTLTLAVTLDADAPVGTTLFAQFLIDTTPGLPGGPFEVSEGLSLTIGRM